jgi:hypothetical protein
MVFRATGTGLHYNQGGRRRGGERNIILILSDINIPA